MTTLDGPGSELFQQLEQLEGIAELLHAGSPVKARMALILLDALADALLYRRLQQIYQAAEEPFLRRKMPQLPRKERLRARQDFNRRVEIARRSTELDRWFGDGSPLISDSDATVLRVGHSLRNLAYHEDRHNPTATESVARVVFGAVARLLARSQRPGVAVGSVSQPRLERLAGWGHTSGSMLDLRAAADAATERFDESLRIDPRELRETLAEDLEGRLEEMRSDISFLAEGGVDPEMIIEGVELWTLYGADEVLLDLQARFDPFALAEAAGADRPSDAMLEDAQTAFELYRERMEELERDHKRRVSLGLLERAASAVVRLRRATRPDRILATYHDVDRPLTELEGYVYTAVIELDRQIQHQIDLARGK